MAGAGQLQGDKRLNMRRGEEVVLAVSSEDAAVPLAAEANRCAARGEASRAARAALHVKRPGRR